MTTAELRERSTAALEKLLRDHRQELGKARFSVRQKQLKNVRKVRDLKKSIARVETLLKEKSV